jgi:hypothetical protein
MPKFKRPCLDCGSLSFGDRCLIHEGAKNRAREARRNTPERQAKKKALYGGDYQRRRQQVIAGATHCHICKQPFRGGEAIEADHLLAGIADSPLAAAHRLCNQRRGDKPLA